MKEVKKLFPIRADVPREVHDYLESLHGSKKYNAEAILIAAARKNGFREQKQTKQSK